MAKLTREDIAAEVQRLKDLGITDRAERKKRILEAARGATPTPRAAGMSVPAGVAATKMTPAAAVESMAASVLPAPSVTSVQPPGPSMSSTGPSMRPMTGGEQVRGVAKDLGLGLIGMTPDSWDALGDPDPNVSRPAQLQGLMGIGLMLAQFNPAERLAGAAQALPAVAKLAESSPTLAKIAGLFLRSGTLGVATGTEDIVGKEVPAGISPADAARHLLETTATFVAMDGALAGLGEAGARLRQPVAAQLFKAAGYLEQKAPGAAGLGPIEKARFLVRSALKVIGAGSTPEMSAAFQTALNDAWKQLGAQEEMVGRMDLVRAAQDEAQRHFNSLFERELPKKVVAAVDPILRAQVKQEAEVAAATPFTKAGLPTPREKNVMSAAQEATLPPLGAPPAERRRGLQAPPGTRELPFADEGGLKEGPLKTGDILWADQGGVKRGRFVAQAPGPAGSTLVRVLDSEGKMRHFSVRPGEERLMVQPRLEEAPAPTGPTAPTQVAPASVVDPRAARLDLIRGRARLRQVFPPTPTAERAVVDASAPKPYDILNGSEALEEVAADPLGKSPIMRTPYAQPSGPIESFSQLRNAAAQEGWRVAAVEGERLGAKPVTTGLGKGGLTQLPVKEQPTTFYTLTNKDGQEMARAATLTDLRAALRAHLSNKHLLLAEPIGELAFADQPEDDEPTRQWKFAARTALRSGTILAMAPLAVPEGSAGRAWGAVRKTLDTKLDAFLTGIADDGARTRAATAWGEAKNAVARTWYALRSPEELFRNHPIARPVVTALSTARRRVDFERNELHEFLKLAGRAGLTPESSAASHAGAILDAVPHDDILKLATTGDTTKVRVAWRTAAVDAEKWMRSVSTDMRDRAILAIDNLTPHQLDYVKQFATRFAGLRDRAKASFKSTFEQHIGNLSPHVLVDTTLRDSEGRAIAHAAPDGGTFVDRFSSEKRAREYITRRAKRIRDKLDGATDVESNKPLSEMPDEEVTGLHLLNTRSPHRDEIDSRFGQDQRAYLTRLVHDGAKAGFNVDDIVDVFPQLDPTHIITEMTKLHNVSISAPYELNGVKYFDRRHAAEALFGPLADTEYRDLMKQAGIAASVGPASAREVIVQGIPQRVYVRYYKDRLKNTVYSLDAAKALAAYGPTVLRDIHYSPILPKVANGVASINITNTDAGLARELKSFVDHHLERERSFEPSSMRAMGFLNAMTYAGMLWGRPASAIRNIVGQTFLVGMSEMGPDTWVAAMRAMADPGVRSLLANERIIHHALPLGNTAVREAFDRVRNAHTAAEATSAVKDTVGSAFNFMAASERFIRMHAFIGGMIEQMKKDGSLNPVSSIQMLSPAGVRPLQEAIRFYQNLPEDAARSLWAGGEDMVRRVAFFFEKSSMPRLYRTVAKIPYSAPAMMFTNFGTNYTNRLTSNIADAFDRRLAPQARRAAQGKILRLVGMTAAIGGPMALPVINMLTNEVSENDPSLGGQLKAFLEPYQAWWQRVFFNRDLQWTGVGAPVADLFSPRRFETAPLVRTVGNLAAATGVDPIEEARRIVGFDAHPMVSAEIVKARQRAFGAASPWLLGGAEPPDDQFLPEAVSKHVPGGGAAEDIIRLITNLDKYSGGIGPLDMRGRPSSAADNPYARLLGGRSASQQQDRLDQKFLAQQTEDRAVRKNSLIRALIDPTLPTKSRDNAFRAIRSNPSILTSLTTADITQFVDDQSWSTLERRILKLPPQDAMDLQARLAGQIARSPHMPDAEFRRKSRAMMAATLAAGK